jgi:DNA mismatch repair protein MutS
MPDPISLLWPPDIDPRMARSARRLNPTSADDLNLAPLVAALSRGYESYSRDIQATLTTLADDPRVLAYRQDVLADLLDAPDLLAALDGLLPSLIELDRYRFSSRPGQSELYEVVWRVGQLESYVEVVEGLRAVFADVGRGVRSAGLRGLRDQVQAIAADETFQQLRTALPEMIDAVRNIASITIGVNLDDRLRPVAATLLSVNREKFRGPSASLLALLFGWTDESHPGEGIAPLHSVKKAVAEAGAEARLAVDPLLHPLFRDLADVLRHTSRPVARALKQYKSTNAHFLGNVQVELAFLLGAAHLVRRLEAAGLPMCRPAIAPKQDRVCELADTVNVTLALRTLDRDPEADLGAAIVPNDAHFTDDGRIFILTGPNQGGKTTYTQAVGLVQVLAQAGLFVPGTAARLSLVDNIYTHFPAEERPDAETGRLGEEARRLNTIFLSATPYSLILLNESLASTAAGESLYLAQDVVRILQRLGARTIYATHLHALAANVGDLNADAPDEGRVISLVAQVREDGAVEQTYRIAPGPPLGRSYAREIAARYGISYEQLEDLLRRRGLV